MVVTHPSWVVIAAVGGTQILATLIAAFGLAMESLPWQYVGLAWVYALVWALILDRAKLFAYDVLERRREVVRAIGGT